LPQTDIVIFFTYFLPLKLWHFQERFPMSFGKDFQGIGRYIALGIQMVVVTFVSVAIGYWLDKMTGKGPLFLIAFFFLGAAAGLMIVYRALRDDGVKPK
jgi:F0F1-type ATP synthase assembly protein I